MVSDESGEKIMKDNANEIAELQKEVKKLREINDGLIKTQIKILQNAIRADKESVCKQRGNHRERQENG